MTLIACGGGSSSQPVSAPAPSKLAAYLGTWEAACYYQTISTVTIAETAGSKDTVTENFKNEYFAQPNCTGPVVATETYSADLTETYTGPADVSVNFWESAASAMTRVDLVTRQGPAYTRSITGPNVVHRVQSGMAMTCVGVGDGSENCVEDQGLFPALAPVAGGIYRSGNKMYRLRLTGGVYYATPAYTKK